MDRWLEKLTILVAILVLGMALAVLLEGRSAVLLVLVMMAVVSVGVGIITRSGANRQPRLDQLLLPNLLIVAAALLLRLVPTSGTVAAGLALYAAMLFLIIWVEQQDQRGMVDRHWPSLGLALAGYALAFALYAAVYQSEGQLLLKPPAVAGITLLVAMRLLRLNRADLPCLRAATYAAFAALAVGEVAWAMNYWRLSGLFNGALLLTMLYFLAQVLGAHLSGRLTPRILGEYGASCLAAAALILWRGL